MISLIIGKDAELDVARMLGLVKGNTQCVARSNTSKISVSFHII